MTRHSLGSPRLILVIDTNVLLLLIGYQYSLSNSLGGPARNRLLNEIRGTGDLVSPDRFDDLQQLFKSADHRIVTQHVIAEAYSLGTKRFFSGKKEIFWKSGVEILRNPGIEEAAFSVRDVVDATPYQKILSEIGPADAGLIYTAQQRKATILTDDGPLQQWASTRNIQWLSLKQIGSE